MSQVVSDGVPFDTKLVELRTRLRGLGRVLVCYSGGVDSAYVLALAHQELGRERVVGMTAVSPSLARSELDEASRVATEIGADHRLVDSHEIDDPSYRRNAPDRCFHCKSELYRIAEWKRAEWGFDAIVNGTNLDDLGDYRPGLEAARAAGVVSPLCDAGFRKADVREGASRLGLGVWDKPAAACLSSRIPFGTEVTPERLARIAGFEEQLRRLGFRRVRVRYHALGGAAGAIGSDATEQAFARIELDAADIARACAPGLREEIVLAGRRHRFLYVTIDLAGYRMGSHNEVLRSQRQLRVVD